MKSFMRNFGISVNLQSVIEKPEVYMLARSSSSEQQILYTDERLSDIKQLTSNVLSSTGIPIEDHLRIFKGDKPASQFEAGQQKGGNFFCFCCPIQADAASSYVHLSKFLYTSISDRIEQLQATNFSLS